MAKWITFEEHQSNGKTKMFNVYNKETGHRLGAIKWYGAFRQYSYFSNVGVVYEKQCLRDIAEFLDKLMLERKVEKQNKKTQQS